MELLLKLTIFDLSLINVDFLFINIEHLYLIDIKYSFYVYINVIFYCYDKNMSSRCDPHTC